MSMYAKVRRLYFREKLSINEIVRRASLSRNTVKKWLRATEVSELQYRRRPMPTKLTPYEDQLKQALIAAIAAVLEISTWTVGTHLRRMFAKFGVNSRAAMVAQLIHLNIDE